MTNESFGTSEALENCLSHIIYASVASEKFQLHELPALIEKAQRKNAGLSITGVLTYSDGCFFQVIEGEKDKLNGLYEEIRSDSRHGNIVTIANEPIARRSFSDWNLRFADMSSVELQEMDSDLREFIEGHQSLREIGKGRAKKLVAAFEAGRWRMPDVSADPESRSDSPFADFSMSFQPIVDVLTRKVYSHEALVRGPAGEPAYTVLNAIPTEQKAAFDLAARNRAVRIASELGLGTALNLNYMPGAAINPQTSLEMTLGVARECGFPGENIIFEATEDEFIDDLPRFSSIVKAGRRYGFKLAVDDFGAGYAGLRMLADFQPDYVKLDMGLVRDIDSRGPRQAIARAVALLCEELGINLVVEGVETIPEYRWFHQLGVRLFQGFLFAKPMFEGRPLARFPPL